MSPSPQGFQVPTDSGELRLLWTYARIKVIVWCIDFSANADLMLLESQLAAAEAPPPDIAHPRLPAVDVVVPFYNEAGLLAAKVANLQDLDYPGSLLRFILVDGQSTDESPAVAQDAARDDSRILILHGPEASKTRQLNFALRWCSAPWILVTDADAHLPRCTLKELVCAATADVRVAVAGVLHEPGQPIHLDRLHWRFWNATRRLEHRVGSTSAALGPCYLLRRDLLACLPEDVVADDMHVSFAALAAGWRIALAETLVIERRAPGATVPLLFHKVRKGRAFLREVLRFLPRVSKMPAPMRELYLWRAAATILAPPLILGTTVLSLLLAPKLSAACGGVALTACLAPLEALAPWRWWKSLMTAIAVVGLGLVLAGVLCVALLSLPLMPQRTSFSRWRQEEL